MKIAPIEVEERGYTLKIYTRTKGKTTYYQLADFSSGTRKLRSFKTVAEAEKEGERIARLMSKGDALGAQMTGAERLEYFQGNENLKGTGVRIPQATNEYAEAKKLLGKTPLLVAIAAFLRSHADYIPKHVGAVVAEMIQIKSGNRMKPISDAYLKDLKRLENFAGEFKCNIGDVTARDIENYISEVSGEGRTQFNYGRLIRTLFNFAEKRSYLPRDSNPFEKIDLDYLDDSEIEIFTPQELRLILSNARSEMIPFLAIGAFAGLRHMEIRRLDWSEVGTDYITVQKGKAKTRSRRLVPVQPNLEKWLTPYRKESGPVIQFEHVSKQLAWLVDDINSAQEKDAAENKMEAPRKFNWKHNALRHSFITYRIAVTKDENLTACEAGNSPKMIHGNYRALATEEVGKEWFKIEPYSQPSDKIVVLPPPADVEKAACLVAG